MKIRNSRVFVFVFIVSAIFAEAQSPANIIGNKPRVLVLGTFHMANPGRDLYNLQADDMLSPKRQGEIVQFVDQLKAFQPTKIAVEVTVGSAGVNQKYQQYLAGQYTLTADEVDQIAFRLAKELGHKQVYPIDVAADLPFETVQEFAKRNGKEEELNQFLGEAPKELQKISGTLQNGSVGDTLRYINQEKQIQSGQALYMRFVRFSGKGEYPGPDFLAEWYRRNARIFSNLRSIIESPSDRVLVIYGSGHAYWLQRNTLDSDDLVLERLSEYSH
jgi:Family of unknown function (DUF5694)